MIMIKNLRTQNCGIVVLGEKDEDSENLDYYGDLANAIELQFVMDKKFKMKPLRIENEVDSNMKNAIEYMFITPSAIDQGQGRGLKSLDEK
uniref:Uncharacterized protein n=1 Tax=Solanum lycopersicum TaxID=4081 RepID=A0A3Q7IHQ9_SOLLC